MSKKLNNEFIEGKQQIKGGSIWKPYFKQGDYIFWLIFIAIEYLITGIFIGWILFH